MGAVSRVLELDGDGWQLREALGRTWEWAVRAEPPAAGNNAAEAVAGIDRNAGWLPARVPGAIVADLVRAGEILDPYVARNSRAAEWAAERSWVVRRTVLLPDRGPEESVLLELDGVDPTATVFWDGVEVGRTGGIYRPAALDLTLHAPKRMQPGPHVLALVLDPAPDSEPQVGRTEDVRVHAPRMGYGWDFCPRLRHQGVWRSVRLRIGPAVLTAVAARTELDVDGARGRVHVQAAVLGGGDEWRITAEVAGARGEAGVRDGEAQLTLEPDRPARWSVRGRGTQTMHHLRIRLHRAGEADAVDERILKVGFRSLDWVQNPGSPPDALAYTAVLDGEPLPLPGWNWVPADVLYGAIPRERVRHLVALAAESGARILRVWGGGLIESDDFYDACDEAGLLVWQEFSQSSSGMQSAPATDPAFADLLVQEAEAVVPRLMRHPSLAVWTGGNELDEAGVPLTEDRSPALAALRDAVQRLDPGRHWLPTSPSGPEFFYRPGPDAVPGRRHDVHGPWEHQGLAAQHDLADEGDCLAHTEFGVEGMTNLRSLAAVLPDPATRWPPDRTNPLYRHLGDWWNNAPLVQAAFGHRLATVEEVQRASQWLQATGLQALVEADRRRAPRCSIVLPWQLDESFPNAWCTCAVDFRGEPKPAYAAVARAFRPRRATIRTGTDAWGAERPWAEAWLWSEEPVPSGSTVRLRLLAADGSVLAEETTPMGAVAEPACALRLEVGGAPTAAVVAWCAEWWDATGSLLDREVQLATTAGDLQPLLDLPPARVAVEVGAEAGGHVLLVRHVGGPIAAGLRLLDGRPVAAAGWAVLGNDPRPLLPGEERRLPLAWRGAADGEPRPVVLDAWNVPAIRIEEPVPGTRAGS
jgi:beta-mannosidase